MELTSSELCLEVRSLKKTVSLMEEKIQRMEEQFLPLHHLHHPEEILLPDRIKEERERIVGGKNQKVMGSSEEQKMRMRKLDERMDEAEEEIRKIKEVLAMGKVVKEKIPPKLYLGKSTII